MNVSHSPLCPSDRMTSARPSHALKSPTTETLRTFGAQTTNE